MTAPLDLLVVGAGPSGLAAAIAAHQAGLAYEVVEKGALVNSIFHFPRHMTFFTTAELLEIGGLPFVTPYEKPTQVEGLKYYRKVTDAFGLRVTLGQEVVGLRRLEASAEGARFAVETRNADGAPSVRAARNVAFATGYYDHPNLLGIPGEEPAARVPLLHGAARLLSPARGGGGREELGRHRRPRAVSGGGARSRSCTGAPQLSDSIKYWIRPDIENRIKEGAIPRPLRDVRDGDPRATRSWWPPPRAARRSPPSRSSSSPATTRTRACCVEAGVRIDETTLVPAHDAATLETNVPGLFLAGALVSGKQTSRIFIENGRFHGETIVGAITGRAVSAR